eukprot:5721017-Alexandrium_andersonii.AAC.1
MDRSRFGQERMEKLVSRCVVERDRRWTNTIPCFQSWYRNQEAEFSRIHQAHGDQVSDLHWGEDDLEYFSRHGIFASDIRDWLNE